MKFGIAQYISQEIQDKGNLILKISNDLNFFFTNKSYSMEIGELYFGFICVNQEAKFYYKPKKPRLSRMDKTFQFEHSFEISDVSEYGENELFSVIFDKLLELPKFLPKRVTDFKIDEYVRDLNEFKSQFLRD